MRSVNSDETQKYAFHPLIRSFTRKNGLKDLSKRGNADLNTPATVQCDAAGFEGRAGGYHIINQ
jgi:ATP/maltotriose-dependent transcriptional regulator MalT